MQSSFSKRRRTDAHRGLTLMELVVVMVILIALAGILLPLFPNMLNRAHTSSSATSGAELSKAIQTYQALYYSYPNQLDNLATNTTGLFSRLAGTTETGASANLTTVALTAPMLNALNSVGIATVAQVVEPTTNSSPIPAWNPTFFPYSAVPTAANAAILSTSTSVAALGPTAIQNLGLAYNATTSAPTYLVFGVGSYTSMSGKTIDDAPVHFEDDPTQGPNLMYARFAAVFQVTDSNGNPLPQAIYSGAVSFHPLSDGGVVGTDAHIKEYFDNISTTN